ncbi:hypothetical protein BDU57DRAFT_44945 [Ampelomyces quisqualis]|uniref:Uncharacterized protein n=1 Tax=Ampelomyces quisqualis TaxID=50730 RepID=A0A6A5R2A8_AMPQU|nr:hypothetical protein BDU57DRAFT_44945 [Ampelomyces quisqualis]
MSRSSAQALCPCQALARRGSSSRTISPACPSLDAEPSVRDKLDFLVSLVVAWHWFQSPHLGSAGPVTLGIMQPRLRTRLSNSPTRL